LIIHVSLRGRHLTAVWYQRLSDGWISPLIQDFQLDLRIFSIAIGLRRGNATKPQSKQVSLKRHHLWISARQHGDGSARDVPLNDAAMDGR
jgi:hypothetical protein